MDVESIPGALVSVGDFPLDDGKYDAVFELAKFPPGIVPGMNCKISLVAYDKSEALLVPRASVFSDDEGFSHYVYIWENDKAEKRDVNIGRDKVEMVEVLRGLVAGEQVLNSKPE
jgi:HlyD family secretion protein